MGVLERMRGGPHASTLANPDMILLESFGALPAKSGQRVNPETAMRCAAVYACIRVLSESIAQLPLLLYRRTMEGTRELKERATDHPLYWTLHNQPNPWQTAFEFRELLMANVLLRGNGYAYINRAGGRIIELLPLHPDRVQVRQGRDFSVSYTVLRDGQEPLQVPQKDMFHLRGLGSDGVTGVSVISYGREAIGLTMAAEEHGAKLFANAARPSGVLQRPKEAPALSETAAKRLVDSFTAAYGSQNALRTALLEEGTTFTPVTIANDDMQFLQTRKFQRSEIAALFRVPPHMIADLERSTFSNIEQQGTDFVVFACGPWIVRWEQAIVRDLIGERQQGNLFAEFLVDGFLRGDIQSRYGAYNQAVNGGWMSRNEVRIKENLNPVDGLDTFLVPLAMGGTAAPTDPTAPPDPGTDPTTDGGDA